MIACWDKQAEAIRVAQVGSGLCGLTADRNFSTPHVDTSDVPLALTRCSIPCLHIDKIDSVAIRFPRSYTRLSVNHVCITSDVITLIINHFSEKIQQAEGTTGVCVSGIEGTPLGVSHPDSARSSWWPRAAQRPKFKIPLHGSPRAIEYYVPSFIDVGSAISKL